MGREVSWIIVELVGHGGSPNDGWKFRDEEKVEGKVTEGNDETSYAVTPKNWLRS